MLEDIVSIPLPVEETLRIRKNVIRNGEGKRICVVTGIHGDELEGQYVCFLLTRMLNRNPDPGGLKYWAGELDKGKQPTAVIEGFVNSKEFIDICNEYGIVRK